MTSDDEQAAEAGKRASEFMRAVTALAREHKLGTGQTVNCFGYLARLMVEVETKRGKSEPEAMMRYVHAFMSGMGAECETTVEPHAGETLQ